MRGPARWQAGTLNSIVSVPVCRLFIGRRHDNVHVCACVHLLSAIKAEGRQYRGIDGTCGITNVSERRWKLYGVSDCSDLVGLAVISHCLDNMGGRDDIRECKISGADWRDVTHHAPTWFIETHLSIYIVMFHWFCCDVSVNVVFFLLMLYFFCSCCKVSTLLL